MIPQDAIDAILFDLDGTLVDTDNAAVDRLTGRLRPLSVLFPQRDPAPFARWLIMEAETPGNAILTMLDMLGLDEALTMLNNRVRRLGRRSPPEFPLMDGVVDTLEDLSRCYKLALVTNRSRRHLAEFRHRHPSIARHLDELVGRQDTMRFKPHPAPLLLAARRLEVPIGRCLMVGDTAVDIRAAQRAGALSAAVLSGFGRPDELARAGAHLVLNSVTELAEFLGC